MQREIIFSILVGRLPCALRGGVGSGKTTALAVAMMLAARLYPGARVMLVMKSRRIAKEVMLPAMRELYPRPPMFGVWRAGDFEWAFPNGSTIKLNFYNPSKLADEAENPIEGGDRFLVIVDEVQQLAPEVFRHATSRARQRVVGLDGELGTPGVVLSGRPSAIEWHRDAVLDALAAELPDLPDSTAARHVVEGGTAVNLANLGPGYMERMRAIYTPEECAALLEGGVFPARGAFFNWSAESWPKGNVIDGFQYTPDRPGWLAIDLGIGRPAVLMIQPVDLQYPDGQTLEAWVIVDDVAPDDVRLGLLVGHVLARAWPREGHGAGPDGSFIFDEVFVDPAAGHRNPQTGRTDLQALALSPFDDVHGPGFGMTVKKPSRADNLIGTRMPRLARQVLAGTGHRRLLMTRELYDKTRRAKGRTFAKSIAAYTWDIYRQAAHGAKTPHDTVTHHVDAASFVAAMRGPRVEVVQRQPLILPARVKPAWTGPGRWR